MTNYFNALLKVLKNWKTAVPVTIFTLARIYYGWKWASAGWHKLAWLSDDKYNSAGMIGGLVDKLATSAKRFDPLGINKAYAWVADNIFLNMPGLTDFLVVASEITIGLLMILGFRVFWGALLALFLNLQFMTAGSTNNFGYIVTDLAFMKWTKYADVIGLDGFLRVRKGKELL